jgi:hypothetical protein
LSILNDSHPGVAARFSLACEAMAVREGGFREGGVREGGVREGGSEKWGQRRGVRGGIGRKCKRVGGLYLLG